MASGKRYRSLRREFFVYYRGGQKIPFTDFRFPSPGQPPCTDPEILAVLDKKVAEGRGIREDINAEEIHINPKAVPEDCDTAHLQAAAKRMMELGIHVNPKLLDNGKREPEPLQLPSRTTVRTSKKEELAALIDKFGWDIDKDQKVDDLREAIFAEMGDSSE